MVWLAKQAQLEARVYDYMDEIADEFELEIQYYPEVFWVGKKTKFEDLALPERFRKHYSRLKQDADALHFKGKIFLAPSSKLDGIAEEAVHCLHYTNSGTILSKKRRQDLEYFSVISEMLAFFGCLNLGMDRKNPFAAWPDSYTQKEMFEEFKEMNEDVIVNNPGEFLSCLVHQQGYTLGERLFYSYVEGKTSKKQIKRLFERNFNLPGSALETFVDLRQKLWPIDKPEWVFEEDLNGAEEEPEFMVIW